MTRSGKPLQGPEVQEFQSSNSTDLATMEGIAGTVALIISGGDYFGTPERAGFHGRCSGVLIARDRVLTNALCVADPANWGTGLLAPEQLFVRFPQLSDRRAVKAVWAWGGGDREGVWLTNRDLAILQLEHPIGYDLIPQIAPVFLGDIDAALRDGILLEDDAILGGFGEDCYSRLGCAEDEETRRLGPVAFPVEVGHPYLIDFDFWYAYDGRPILQSFVPVASTATIDTNFLDVGGPLFLREAKSGRYVVVGTFSHLAGNHLIPFHMVFTYLGRVGNNPRFDNDAIIRRQLGEFINGTPCEPWELGRDPRNSNYAAEMDIDHRFGGMEYLNDRCDSVPLMVFDEPLNRKYTSTPLHFSMQSWVGSGAITSEFDERPVNRFCDCFDAYMNPVPMSECLEGRCYAGDVNKGMGSWKGIYLTWKGRNGQTEFLPPGAAFPDVRVRERRIGEREFFDWSWTNDVPGQVRGVSTTGYQWTRGFLGVALQSQGVTRSIRDDAWDGDLRGTVSFYDLEVGTPSDPTPPTDPPPPPTGPPPPPANSVPPCSVRDCLSWGIQGDFDLHSRRGWPWWWPGPGPNLFANDLGRYLLHRGGDTYEDISTAIGPVLYELLGAGAGQDRWVSTVESAHSLSVQGISERAVLVLSGGEAFSVKSTLDGLEAFAFGGSGLAGITAVLAAEQPAGANFATLAAATSLTLDVPSNGRALYSATEGAVYVVAGPDKGLPGAIRRTDLAIGQTYALSFVGATPSGTILGATYVPEDGKLYVLDTAEGLAQLTVYDVVGLRAYVLWSVPFTDEYNFTSLSHAVSGELILTAAAEDGYTAWLLREKSNGLPSFLGRLDRGGRPVDEPVMGPFGPSLPVLHSRDELRYDVLDIREFENGAPCEAL